MYDALDWWGFDWRCACGAPLLTMADEALRSTSVYCGQCGVVDFGVTHEERANSDDIVALVRQRVEQQGGTVTPKPRGILAGHPKAEERINHDVPKAYLDDVAQAGWDPSGERVEVNPDMTEEDAVRTIKQNLYENRLVKDRVESVRRALAGRRVVIDDAPQASRSFWKDLADDVDSQLASLFSAPAPGAKRDLTVADIKDAVAKMERLGAAREGWAVEAPGTFVCDRCRKPTTDLARCSARDMSPGGAMNADLCPPCFTVRMREMKPSAVAQVQGRGIEAMTRVVMADVDEVL